MGMSTNQGGLRQNLPSTFKDNAPNGGRPQTGQSLANIGQAGLGQMFGNQGDSMPTPVGFRDEIDTGELKQIDPGFNVNPLLPGVSGGGKGGMFGPGIVPGSGGGKSMPSPAIPIQGEAPPDQGFIKSPQPTLPPQMQQPMPGPGYVGGIRTPPSNYRPPNQGGGILRSRRTGMPINR